MTPQQKQLMRELVQKYSEHPGTEALLAYVVETNGMLPACKTLLHIIKTGDSVSTDWLFRDCLQYNVVFHLFLEEISRLTALLDSGEEDEDLFNTLTPGPETDEDGISQTHHTLSPQYHPETASPPHRDLPEKIIETDKAYDAQATEEETEEDDRQDTPDKQPGKNGVRRPAARQKKKLIIWTSAILVILLIVSTGVFISTQNKAMLAGLERGRALLVESIDTVLKSIQPEAVTDRSHKQQEAVLQPPPEAVTRTSNDSLTDGQKRPVASTSPENTETLDAAETPGKDQPFVAARPETATDNSHEQQRPVPQKGFATPPPSEKPLLTLQNEQTEQFSPEPVTNDTRLPDVPELPVITTSPEQIDTAEDGTTANDATLPDRQRPPVAATSVKAIETPDAAARVAKKPLESKLSILHQTKQHLNSRSAPPETSIHTLPENIALKRNQVRPNMQSRIDIFLNDYTKVYQQRDLVLFSRLFAADAVENGKPFSSLLPTYRELFAATSDITLKVENITWKEHGGKFAVQGRFELKLQYNDSHTFSGTGPIRFVLIYNNENFKVAVLEYEFSAGS